MYLWGKWHHYKIYFSQGQGCGCCILLVLVVGGRNTYLVPSCSTCIVLQDALKSKDCIIWTSHSGVIMPAKHIRKNSEQKRQAKIIIKLQVSRTPHISSGYLSNCCYPQFWRTAGALL